MLHKNIICIQYVYSSTLQNVCFTDVTVVLFEMDSVYL